MKNFKIIESNSNYLILPTTLDGGALAAHCRYHGEDFVYPTKQGAEDKVMEMDSVLTLTGKRWVVYANKEKSAPAATDADK